jgi:hypothetical protein
MIGDYEEANLSALSLYDLTLSALSKHDQTNCTLTNHRACIHNYSY